MSGMPFFLRLDDISDMDRRAVCLIEGALAAGFPVLAAVIPAQLTADTASWLTGLVQRHGSLLDVGQHGFRHENHVRGKGHGEFCRQRTRAEQARDLERGAAIMDDCFGERWSRIFVPPFNHLTRSTVELLVEMSYRGLSTIHLPAHGLRGRLAAWRYDWAYRLGGSLPAHRNGYRVDPRLPCVSPVLDLVADYARPAPLPLDALDARVAHVLADGTPMLGMMLHHWVYRDADEAGTVLPWLHRTVERYGLAPVPVSRLLAEIV